MKTHFSLIFKSVYSSLLFCLFWGQANSQTTPVPLAFKNGKLLSGTALGLGAVYEYKNVNQQVNAHVRIDSLVGGATVLLMDSVGTGYDNALQPRVRSLAGGNSYAVFSVTFLTQQGAATSIPKLSVTGLDIDGSSTLKEFIEMDLGGGSYHLFSHTPDIEVVKKGTGFRGTNVKGVDVAGIDTTNFQVMYGVEHTDVSKVILRLGSNINAGGSANTRNFSVLFQRIQTPVKTLPVTFQTTKANKVNGYSVIEWTCSQEQVLSYQVEKSTNGTSFAPIGTVAALKNGVASYRFTDNGPSAGKMFYRIKAIDIDGSANYSTVVMVAGEQATSAPLTVSTFPNPATTFLKALLPTQWQGKTVTFTIYTLQGNPVKAHTGTSASVNTIDVSALPRGYYSLQVQCGQEMCRQTFVK